MKNPQPDVDIEINYDAELEEFGSESDAADARFIRVRIEDRNIVPGSLKLEPPDPENQTSGDFLVCPVQIRANTADYTEILKGDRTVRFRAELDLASIMAAWTTVQEAAKELRRFLIKVQIETNRPSGPREVTRHGRLKINLNTIRWTWTPLIRDKEGAPGAQNGDEQDNTPIELAVDGTDKNGFRLEVERGVLRQDGEYEAAKSDFTHYLSPDGKVDNTVVFLEPEPWDPKIQPTQQIVTTWWTKVLPADHKLLSNLPVETSIRVQAFPEHSIKKRAPRHYLPENTPRLAIREIPLMLGVSNWKARVITPNPDQPFLLVAKRPWEDGFEVQVEIFDDSKPDSRKVMKNGRVVWTLRPGLNNKPTAGSVADAKGGLIAADAPKASRQWTTDEAGILKFKFCPKKENSIFLGAKDDISFLAEFDLNLPGGSADELGKKIPNAETPDDKTAPSFVIDWAPKFDLGVFKLPFFIPTGEVLDLEPEPDEDTAKPIVLTLTNEDEYCCLFREGGTFILRPIVPWQVDKERSEFDLRDYRLLVGEQSRTGSERRIPLTVNGWDGSNYVWPTYVSVPGRSGQGSSKTVELKPPVELHPDVKKFLTRVADEASKVEGILASSKGLPKLTSFIDTNTDFRRLGISFGATATGFFAETKQKELIDNRKPIMFTLSGMPMFTRTIGVSWNRLGAAINVHRQTYKRMESSLLSFYYDFLCWKPLEEAVSFIFKKLRQHGAFSWLPEKAPPVPLLNWLVRKGQDAFQTYLIKGVLERYCLNPIKQALTDLRQHRQETAAALAEIDAARQAAAATLTKFRTDVTSFRAQADRLTQLMAQVEAAGGIANAPAELIQECKVAVEALKQTAGGLKQFIREGPNEALKRRLVTECQYRGTKATDDAFQEVDKYLEKSATEVEALLKKDSIAAKNAKAVADKFENPEMPAVNSTPYIRQEAAQLIEQETEQHATACDQLADKLRQLKEGRGLTTTSAPAGPIDVSVNFASDINEMQQMVATAPQQAREFVPRAKDLLDRRLQGAVRVWETEKALVSGQISRGVKKGSLVITEKVREALDAAPTPPAATPAGSPAGTGAITSIWDRVKSAFSWLVGEIEGVIATAFSWFITIIGWVLRIILFPLQIILLLHSRLGLKICELVIAFFDLLDGPDGWHQVSALTEKAREAAATAGDRCSAPLGTIFKYPYLREKNAFDKMGEAAEQWVVSDLPYDRSVEQMISQGTESGFDDYYPSQLKDARGLLFKVAQTVLDKPTLQTPPCDEDPGARTVRVMSAGDSLDMLLKEYQASTDLPNLGKKSFFAPFWKLWGQGSWNLVDFDTFCDWVGWTFAWSLRLLALIVALVGLATTAAVVVVPAAPILGLVEIELSAGLLLGAQAVSAVTSAVRGMVTAFGFYPFTAAYPRDAVALHVLHYAMVFKGPSDRFEADSPAAIVQGYPQAT